MDGMMVAAVAERIPCQADSDEHLVALWLHGRGPRTLAAYATEARLFLAFLDGRPLRAVRLGDLHAYADSLAHLAPASQASRLGAIKSLFSFGHRLGYLPFNTGAAVRLPTPRCARAERILSESDVHRLIALEPNARNRALLHLAYAAGLRISELAGLSWSSFIGRDDTGQVTVFGKGAKTRAILLPASTWRTLQELREGGGDGPVFRSRKGGKALGGAALHHIVKGAAKRAGLPANVSAHWLRHAHASHSLDRGAPISLVQATLGHSSVATTGRYLHARPGDSSARYLGL